MGQTYWLRDSSVQLTTLAKVKAIQNIEQLKVFEGGGGGVYNMHRFVLVLACFLIHFKNSRRMCQFGQRSS